MGRNLALTRWTITAKRTLYFWGCNCSYDGRRVKARL